MWTTIALATLLTAICHVHICHAAGFAYVWQTFDDNNNVLVGIPEAFKWPSPPAPVVGNEENKAGEGSMSISEKSMEDPTSRAGSAEESGEGSEGGGSSEGSSESGSKEGSSGSSEGSSSGSGESKDSSTSSRETEKEPGSDTKEETTQTTSSLFPPKTFKGFPPIKYSPPIPFAYSKKSFGTYALPPPPTAALSFPPPPATRIQYLPYKSPMVYSPQILPAQPSFLPIRPAPPPPPPPPPAYTIPFQAAVGKSSGNIFYNPFIASNITAIPAAPALIKTPRITAISPKVAAAASPYRILPALPPAPSAPLWFY